MWKVDLSKVTNWRKLLRSNHCAPTTLDVTCPYPECKRSMIHLLVTWGDSSYHTHACVLCSNCKRPTHFFLVNPPRTSDAQAISQSTLYQYPAPQPVPVDAVQIVNNLAPDYIELYRQAGQAEKLGLTKLSAAGYYRALECFLKSYCCSEHYNDSEQIKAMSLGACIKHYVDDPGIQDAVKRLGWITDEGETHCAHEVESKDIDGLKTLIELMGLWISSHLSMTL